MSALWWPRARTTCFTSPGRGRPGHLRAAEPGSEEHRRLLETGSFGILRAECHRSHSRRAGKCQQVVRFHATLGEMRQGSAGNIKEAFVVEQAATHTRGFLGQIVSGRLGSNSDSGFRSRPGLNSASGGSGRQSSQAQVSVRVGV